MVAFKEKGVNKLMDCAMGRRQVVITGEVGKYFDELSILLTKTSHILGKDCSYILQNTAGVYTLGSGSVTESVDASELFKYFDVKHIIDEIPPEVINSRNTGLCYFPSLGECGLLNTIFDTYTFNDGSVLENKVLQSDRMMTLKKDALIRFMPDLYKKIKKSEKAHTEKLEALGLSGITEDSRVRIKPYSDLVTKFGEQILVMGDDDNVQIVEASEDPDAVRFIKQLGYSKLSADYYDNKVGVIKHIDQLTGNLVLLIDGISKHTMFMDEGVAQSNSGEGIVFTLEHIAKA